MLNTLVDIRTKAENDVFDRRVDIVNGVILRLLSELGWDIHDPRIVKASEVNSPPNADLSLAVTPGDPKVLIKAMIDGDIQEGRYGEVTSQPALGVDLLIVASDVTWRFYGKSNGHRGFPDLVEEVALLLDSPESIVDRLMRLVSLDSWDNGRAKKFIQRKLQTLAAERLAEELPTILAEMFANPDQELLSLIIEQVIETDLPTPSTETVETVLRKMRVVTEDYTSDIGRSSLETPEMKVIHRERAISRESQKSPAHVLRLTIEGRVIQGRNQVDLFISALEYIYNENPSSLLKLYKKGSISRRPVAPSPQELYPTDPDHALNTTYWRRMQNIREQWYVDVNLNAHGKISVVRRACEAADIEFGYQIKFYLVDEV